MLSFHHPEYLWALLLLPVLLLLLWQRSRWQRTQIRKLADAELQPALWSDGRTKPTSLLRYVLPVAAVACLALAAAGLYEPKGGDAQPAKGVDVIIALDASRSMKAKDIQPDRLSRAFSFINRLTEKLEGDRIGLVVFAGRAYLQVPLTTDRSAFKMALQSTRLELLPTQGTVLAPAIEMATGSFADNQRRSRALIIVTDGEDHDEGAPDAARAAEKAGVKLFGVGVGTPQGTVLYEADGSVKTGPDGEQVVTRLGEEALRDLMQNNGGQYRRLQDAQADAAAIAAAIKQLPATALSGDSEASAKEYFPYFTAATIALLLLGSLLQSVRRNASRVAAPVLLFLMLFSAANARAQSAWQQGDKLYRAGKFAEAIEAYKKALSDSDSRAAAQYNLGNALYKKGDFTGAAQAFEQAAKARKSADAMYNAGNSFAGQQKWQEALNAYKEALRKQPGSPDAQRNYAYARKKLQQQQQQQQEQKKQQQQQKEQEKEEPRPDPSNLTKQQAEKMLQALRQEEQKTADRKKENNSTASPPAKDW